MDEDGPIPCVNWKSLEKGLASFKGIFHVRFLRFVNNDSLLTYYTTT